MNIRPAILILTYALFVSLSIRAAVNTDYPLEQEFKDDGSRYSILAIKDVSHSQASEDAIYISSFLNLPVYIIKHNQLYRVFVGRFIHQEEVPHFMNLLRMAGYRKLSFKKISWNQDQIAAQFNQEYASTHEIIPSNEYQQIKEDAVKVIGKQPDAQPDLWVSVPENPTLEARLRQGWLYLSKHQLETACPLFEELRSDSLIKIKATYGLASCYHYAHQPDKSVPLYMELMINDQGIEYFIIEFLDDLNALGRKEDAKYYQQQFESLTKDYWSSEQYLLHFNEQLDQAIKNNEISKVFALLVSHKALLNHCEAIGSYYNGANFLLTSGYAETAKDYYQQLFESCPEKWHLKLGLISSLSGISSLEEMKSKIQQEQTLSTAPKSYQHKLKTLLFNIEVNKAYELPQYSQESYQRFQALNTSYPNTPKILNRLGWWHYKHEQYDEAHHYFERSQSVSTSEESTKGVLYSLLQLGKKEQALSHANHQSFEDIQLNLLKDQLQRLELKDARIPEMSREILSLVKEDLSTETIEAWHFYEVEKYQDAKTAFARLHQRYPEDLSFLKGYVYSLMRLGEVKETEVLFDKQAPQDKELEQVATGIYMKNALHHYEGKNYSQALHYINKYLSLNPDNQDALALRSWIHFHSNEKAKAISDLERVWQASPTEQHTKSLLFLYSSQAEEDSENNQYQNFLTTLETSTNPEWNNIAATEYDALNQPIRAAQISDVPQASFRNADSPQAHLAVSYRNKSGDKGTSQLQQTGVYLGADVFSDFGKQWRLMIGWEALNAGQLPLSPFIGRAYLEAEPNQPIQTPETDLVSKRVWLQHFSETGLLRSFTLGTTAIDSLVSVQPVFEIEGSFITNRQKQRSGPFWNIHQRLIDDTVLSYLGQHDPYSNQEWGRVMMTGITLGNQWNLNSPYWMSSDVSGDYYWGNHLWKNYSIKANASLGRTDIFDSYLRSVGLYSNLQHFHRNSNFFTYGHGGYYSPQVLVGSGPFAVWEATKQKSNFWWKAETSTGVFWQSNNRSPLYPISHQSGSYDSDSGAGVGVRLKLQYRKLWSQYFETSGLIEWRKAPDYDESRIQATFRMYFEPRNALTIFEVEDRIDLP